MSSDVVGDIVESYDCATRVDVVAELPSRFAAVSYSHSCYPCCVSIVISNWKSSVRKYRPATQCLGAYGTVVQNRL